MKRKATRHKKLKQELKATTHNSLSLAATLRMHGDALGISLLRLLRTPFSSFMAIIVMAIALSLAGSFYTLMSNTQQLMQGLQSGKQVSLFLDEQLSDEAAEDFARTLLDNHKVERVSFISKEHALAEFQQYSGFGDALNALESNPLPAVIQVFPNNIVQNEADLNGLIAEFQLMPEVDFAQVDMNWVARLQGIIAIIDRFVIIIALLLAFAVLLITANTIRAELQMRSEEVIVQKLVGATDRFIRLPFLYSGFWFCFISGILAWFIVSLMLLMISEPIESLSFLYQSHFEIHFMSLFESLIFVLGSALLGTLGAFIVINYQLRLLKPE